MFGDTDPGYFYLDSTEAPTLAALVRELRLSLRAQRDHLDDLTTIVNHLQTTLGRLPNHQGGTL